MSKYKKRVVYVSKKWNKLSPMLVAKKALRKVNQLRKVVYNERKMHDIGSTTIAPTIAGLVNHFTIIGQGDGDTVRDGLAIRAFFCEFRFTIVKHVTPTVTNCRFVIVRDNRQVESTAPSFLDVMLAADPKSQYSRVNPKRFTVLYNKLLTLRTNRIAASGTFTRKLNFPVNWVGASGASITKNGIFFLSNSDAAAAQEPTLKFTFRLHFTDV